MRIWGLWLMEILCRCNSVISPLPLWERGWGRGGAFGKLFQDGLEHHFDVLQNVVVPKTQHRETLVAQPCITCRIVHAAVVLPAICLDDQTRTEMHEVHDIWPDRLLPAELVIAHAVRSEMAPEQLFRVGHVFA